MAEIVTWGALIAGLGALISTATLWLRVGSLIGAATKTSESAERMAIAAVGKNELLARDLSDHRELMAGKTAMLKTLIETNVVALSHAEQRLAKGQDDIMGQLKQVNERLDRLVERGAD